MPPSARFYVAAQVVFVVGTLGINAEAGVIDFEGLPDSTVLAAQYPGMAFTNALVLTSGISLNEFEFPPHSGTNVASDNGGPVRITFTPPVQGFSGYFTYGVPLTIAAFDNANHQVATATSHFSSNEALSGDPGSSPNELLQVNSSGTGIASVTITGDPGGQSFALDDVSLTATVPSPTPVPTPLPPSLLTSLLSLILLAAIFWKRFRVSAFGSFGASALVLGIVLAVNAIYLWLPAYAQPSAPAGHNQDAGIERPFVKSTSHATIIVTVHLAQSLYIPGSINLVGFRADHSKAVLGRFGLMTPPSGASTLSLYVARSGAPLMGRGVVQFGVSAAIRGHVGRVLSPFAIVKK